MIRIHNVARWSRMKPGKELVLQGDRGRKIVLEVNCPEPTRFDLVGKGKDDQAITFLAVVHGLESIEFFSDDPVAVVAATTDADFWLFTSDGENIGYVVDERPVHEGGQGGQYTRIMDRPARNPEFERLQAEMRLNEWRRNQKQSGEIAELRAMLADMARKAGADEETGEIKDETTEPKPDAHAAGPDAKPAVKGAKPDAGETP